MTKLLPDVPVAVLLVHLTALAVLLSRAAATRLQRTAIIRQSRDAPSPRWLRLLHVLLGLSR